MEQNPITTTTPDSAYGNVEQDATALMQGDIYMNVERGSHVGPKVSAICFAYLLHASLIPCTCMYVMFVYVFVRVCVCVCVCMYVCV